MNFRKNILSLFIVLLSCSYFAQLERKGAKNLIDDNEGIIEYKLEEWIEKGVKYPEMMRKFNRYIEKKDNNKVINKIKDEIKLLLYNNRNIVNKEEPTKAIEVN